MKIVVKSSKIKPQANDLLLSRFEKGLKEAKKMKEGKLLKRPSSELYGNH